MSLTIKTEPIRRRRASIGESSSQSRPMSSFLDAPPTPTPRSVLLEKGGAENSPDNVVSWHIDQGKYP
jgi:hypothetical protein